jgi:hypothetical protein
MTATRRLLTVLTVLLAGVTGGAQVAHAAPRTVIFNLTAAPLERPDRVFFQANSGPYLADLTWAGWGTERAVGTGTWTLDCTNGGGSCGPEDRGIERHPARYVLSGPVACPRFGADARTYRDGVVEVDRDGGTQTVPFDSDGGFCVRRPPVTTAKAAVRRYLVQRGPARSIVVSCRVTGPQDFECKARWTQRGKRRIRGFFVFATEGGKVVVRPFGT